MWKAIVYKEWLKTRWFVIGLSLLGVGLLAYIFITLERVFRHLGMVEVFDVIVNRHNTLYAELKYYPVIFGVLLALAQFIPEIQKKRLKLTLHLPVSQKTTYFTMQSYGIVVLFVCFMIQLFLLYGYSVLYFPQEIIASAFISLLPWYSAGFTAYLFTALICLESVWIRRIIYLLIAFGVLYSSYLTEFPGAYRHVWWLLLLLPIYVFTLPWLSIERFKKGIQ